MTKKEWSLTDKLIATGSVIAAPFTGGMSLAGLAIPFLGSGDNSEEERRRREEEKKERDDQYNKMLEIHNKQHEDNKKNIEATVKELANKNSEVERITAILNNPNSTAEEKSNAKKKLVILEDEIRETKKKLKQLEEKQKHLEDNPPKPKDLPWKLPKIDITTKVIIAGSVLLLTYFVFVKDREEKSK